MISIGQFQVQSSRGFEADRKITAMAIDWDRLQLQSSDRRLVSIDTLAFLS